MKDTNNVSVLCCKSALSTEDNFYVSHIKRRETSNVFIYFLGYNYFNRSGSIMPPMMVAKFVVMNVGFSGSGLI
jgi:hypothetical protein